MEVDYTFFLDKLKNKSNFSLARYGDGEWGCILQDQKTINRIVEAKREKAITFSKKFFKIFKTKPNYYIGIQPRAKKEFKKEIEPYYRDLENVINGDVFHNMSESKGIKEFLYSLSSRKVIIVGPKYFKNLNFSFTHIKTPEEHVWNSYYRIKKKVLLEIEKEKENNPVILYSCSFVAKVLINDMYNIYENRITQIDTGSLFDPYCGLKTRNYHKRVLNKIKNNNEQWCI